MTTLLYLANARIPAEKAHGLQIMQNCEAFAEAGAEVKLWTAYRANTATWQAEDPWEYYGVKRNFGWRQIPCLDLQPWFTHRLRWLHKAAFYLHYVSYLLALLIALPFQRAEIYYSRDMPTVLLLGLLKAPRHIAYEPHRLSQSRLGRILQRRAVQRAGQVFPITQPMAEALIAMGAEPERVTVAHDGIRAARFDNPVAQAAARQQIGWPQDAFIVGYVGQLHTMAMDKGLGLLIDALAQLRGVSLGLVGGPDTMAETLRQQWIAAGLPESDFLYAGQVAPDAVPLYLSAFDVCAMPHPYTAHFARSTSPLKLFEYMASQRPIVASDMPGWADVVQHGEHALLVAPGDVTALSEAIRCLRDDPALRQSLAGAAYERVMAHYTWAQRARMILDRCGAMA